MMSNAPAIKAILNHLSTVDYESISAVNQQVFYGLAAAHALFELVDVMEDRGLITRIHFAYCQITETGKTYLEQSS